MVDKPKAKSSKADQELDRLQKQFDEFEENVKSLTLDTLQAAPKKEQEPQTLMSQKDLERSKDLYLKPAKIIPSREKFNERFRDEYDFAKEYVHFIAENKEIIGERAELWTKPFPGCPAEFWQVPVNKPVWGPRYLAERIRGCVYSELHMDESQASNIDGGRAGTIMGQLVQTKQINRLDAQPVINRKSIFMGSSGF